MAQRLKRWESPRREGRNDKGRGGSARRRQLKKQTQALRKKLKDQSAVETNKNLGGRDVNSLPSFFATPTAHRAISYSVGFNCQS
ncbi:MAG: hypothetical protein KME08_06860 [Aphanothece sp. CMT-3BRIN-NPC111]|nr:hypothetical protein [Aphanothece sp. CMT-3BRIN-NPC111]